MSILVETFPALTIGGLCINAFVGRVTDLDVATDRETALERLNSYHEQARNSLGFFGMPFVSAQQVHGNLVAVVEEGSPLVAPEADALITNLPNVCLGIYVADCCAVYAIDVNKGCIGLAHSGKKGTELGIVPAMLAKMTEVYGCDPATTIVQLSPCIRPPLYEADFAKMIVEQCKEMGIAEVVDPGTCTGADLGRYYSYRMEKGRTGRMLALLALKGQE